MARSHTKQFAGGLLIFIGLAVGLALFYRQQVNPKIPLIFSQNQTLEGLWQAYKGEYWESSTGRTVDKQRDNVTTSEGQSYTLLRAVWQGDQPTFDSAWAWTKQQLDRPQDHLFSWMWGQKTDGSYGILVDQGGFNTASDADVDIAMALTFAASRWQKQAYLDDAKLIVGDIWEKEVVTINGLPYLVANNLEKELGKTELIVNPSYFSPAAFRIFAKIDPKHDWMKLVDSSYKLIENSAQAPLDTAKSSGLPPDWIVLNATTGAIQSPAGDLSTNYSYDAMRTIWRLSLDWQWFEDARAKSTLKQFSYLNETWEQNEALYSSYNHDGSIDDNQEVPAIYGGSIGYFKILKPETADKIYKLKLQSLYDPDDLGWKQTLNYYDDNWAWFGIGLYTEQLPNLAKEL